MNTGKTLFAQLMDFLPWTTFTRIVDRYGGDHRVRRFPAPSNPVPGLRPADLPGKPAQHLHASLYHMGFRQPVRRSTLADPTKGATGDPCGVGPAAHHPGEDAVRRRRTGVGPDQYRLRPGLDDHRSVPVGLSVGALPHHQGGGDNAARPAGQHSEFYLSDGKLHDVHALDLLPEAGGRGSWLPTLPAFMCCTKPGPSSSRVPSNIDARLFGADGSLDRHHLRPDHLPGRLLHPSGLPRTTAAHPLQSPARRWSSSPTTSRAATITKAAGRWNSSSSGSSSIFGSSSSTARRRTR